MFSPQKKKEEKTKREQKKEERKKETMCHVGYIEYLDHSEYLTMHTYNKSSACTR